MKAYNVEIWDSDFNYKSHTITSDVTYKYDYLSYAKNSIKCSIVSVEKGDYISISNSLETYQGIVTEISLEKTEMKITYIDFMQLLDVDFLPMTDKKDTLEILLVEEISKLFVNNSDTLQNITGLELQVFSSTNDYVFMYENEVYNLYDDLIVPALVRYQVAIEFYVDFGKKKLIARIGKNATTNTIETELPNCKIKTFKLKITKNTVNKLEIYNEEFTESVIYYKKTDGTFGTTDGNRITPVEFQIESVSVGEDETLAEKSLEKATTIFEKTDCENLIELEFEKGDTLVNPLEFKIGQKVNVIKDGVVYNSYLTGKEVKDEIKLVFGNIRLELTKKLKGR